MLDYLSSKTKYVYVAGNKDNEVLPSIVKEIEAQGFLVLYKAHDKLKELEQPIPAKTLTEIGFSEVGSMQQADVIVAVASKVDNTDMWIALGIALLIITPVIFLITNEEVYQGLLSQTQYNMLAHDKLAYVARNTTEMLNLLNLTAHCC